MRASLGLAVLLGFGLSVSGSKEAASWEAIYLYLAYRSDFAAHAPDFGSMSFSARIYCGMRPCTFGEFLFKGYQHTRNMKDYLFDHANFDPLSYNDITDAARQMHTDGWNKNKLGMRYVAKNLYGTTWFDHNRPAGFPNSEPQYARVIEHASNIIQAATRSHPSEVLDWREKAADVLNGVREERLADTMANDWAKSLVVIGNELPKGVQVPKLTMTTMFGNTYDTLDHLTLVNELQALGTFTVRGAVRSIGDVLNNIKSALKTARDRDPILRPHWTNINAAKDAYSRLAGDNFNC